MDKIDVIAKNPSSRSIALKATKARRKAMVIKVFSFNIQKNKLSKEKKKYLSLLNLEAKYYYNYLVYCSQIKVVDNYGDIVYPNNLFEFNTKSNLIKIFNHEDNIHVDYELKILSSQVKQEILKKIQSSIKGLSSSKSKGRKIGILKYKSFVNIPFKQFNNSFYLSDDCKKLSIQGNRKDKFHLIRNKNLSNLASNLQLTHKSITTTKSKFYISNKEIVENKNDSTKISSKNSIDKQNFQGNYIKNYKKVISQTHQNVSLKKLIDLGIIEIANAEIVSSYKKDSYSFKLTVYIHPAYLEKANLFQGTQLNDIDRALLNRTNLGLDAGVASELTVNCNEAYASISINSREPVSKFQINKMKRLRRYQRKCNRFISKSKKANKLYNERKTKILDKDNKFSSDLSNNLELNSNKKSVRNNDKGFYTNKFKELKLGLNNAQTSMNNHKTDTIAKLTSIFDLFNKITFQDEMIKSWHQNKTFNFSTPIQKGILGKTYAKMKNKYDSPDNIQLIENKEFDKNFDEEINTNSSNQLVYHYQKLSKSLRTTKTCICANIHKNITLKDRVYVCEYCGYQNNRDTHSSYIINNTLNHINFDLKYKENLGCGTQSKDLILDHKSLLLDSNLGKITTSRQTNKIYHIFLNKLKSQNLAITFNHEVLAKNIQEASSFRAV